MKKSLKEIEQIEGEVYLLSRLKPDERLAKLSEITTRVKKILNEFDKRRKQHLQPVRRCLVVLSSVFDSGHVSIMSSEDREIYQWCRKEIRYYLEHWDELE